MRPVTQQQKRVLNVIKLFVRQREYPPTLTEIGNVLGLSKQTVFAHVSALEKKGFLTREAGKPRKLVIKETA